MGPFHQQSTWKAIFCFSLEIISDDEILYFILFLYKFLFAFVPQIWESRSGICLHTLGPGSDDSATPGHTKKISAIAVNELQPCTAIHFCLLTIYLQLYLLSEYLCLIEYQSRLFFLKFSLALLSQQNDCNGCDSRSCRNKWRRRR